MRSFAGELADLHRLAATTAAQDFPAELIGHLRRWIGFDGAVLGTGMPADDTLRIATATVHGRDEAILQEYAAVSHEDPVTAAFLGRPGHPIAVDAGTTYAGPQHGVMARFARRHDLRHLLLCGDAPQGDAPMRWIVLYRGTREGFDRQAMARIGAAWAHVSCALDLQRAQWNQRPALPEPVRALALVDAGGSYHAADPLFHELMAREWPQAGHLHLPAVAKAAMAGGMPFHGQAITLSSRRLGVQWLCEAQARRSGAALSPREQAVAGLFASGRTHKEVAKALHTSPHTVRAQLAQVYRKLGIQDKTALVRCLAAQGEDASLSSQVPRSSPAPR
ncbi:helix-turn-helix transcriptional regulator [Aquincola sp. J276]|uniref:helix-turn-helix transcriptional regulator n=1 Tax=Aquincola sp. J276 TaxID=2898432 RepID=UPI00215186B4|nr:helix-turn-helix transcriptional regulator [Aquincola sp. J276]MCR5868538.1 helix-turn-helix transcriptional regulator [Aquincola sp. J276]